MALQESRTRLRFRTAYKRGDDGRKSESSPLFSSRDFPQGTFPNVLEKLRRVTEVRGL